MKSYKQFIQEAKLHGNIGTPDEFLKGIETKAQKELGVRMDNTEDERRVGMELMGLIERSKRLMFGGLNTQQIEERRNKLQDLAKSVILSNYGSLLDNVTLNIKLVPSVIDALPEIGNIKQKPNKEDQKKEMSKNKSKEDENKDKKQSFLDKMFGDNKKDDDFLNSDEYKKRVDKAKIINNIIQGEAKNTKHILHTEEVKDGLRDIFGDKWEEVFNTFNSLTKAADKLDWAWDLDRKSSAMADAPQFMAGAVKVSWPEAENPESEEGPSSEDAEDILKNIENGEELNDNEEEISELLSNGNPQIFAVGLDFPMLLHETVKGIYQLIASAYLPSSKDSKEEISKAKVVQMGVSSFEDESEDFRYGPYIASSLRDFVNTCKGIDKHENMRDFLFGWLVLLKEDKFLSLMRDIFEKKPSAKKEIEDMIVDIIEYNNEENSKVSKSEYSEEDYGEKDEEESEIDRIIKNTTNKSVDDDNSNDKDVRDMNETELKKYVSSLSKKEIETLIDELIDSGDFKTITLVQNCQKK